MARPVVAITTYEEPARWGAWSERAALLPSTYVDKVRAAGARVVLLPPDDGDTDVLAHADALVLSGGADLDARLYGQRAHPSADEPREPRDASEVALYLKARELGLPVLGICRGLQVMAIAHGGALEQNVPDLGLGTSHRDAPGSYTRHSARFAPDSLIANLLGAQEVEVNSSHHQCVRAAGTLTVTGWADDGTIEVCEDPAAPFVLGVQWHPEADDDPRLFEALVVAARSRT